MLTKTMVKEVDYGTFMSKIEDKKIDDVQIEDNQILFTDKDDKNTIYKTGVMEDPTLTERLYKAGAKFSKEIDQQLSPVASFLLTGVLPLIIFIALGQYLSLIHILTDKPFGVNIMLMNPEADKIAKVILEEDIKVVTTGAGSPEKYMADWKAAGVKVIPVIASVALAKRMERCGADAVVAEGTEAGGHIGELTTMVLVPQVVDAVNIPVIAAGGIADGRGMAAAFMLGARGIQMGTIFAASKESVIHENYKNSILKAKDIDSRVTGRSTGHPIRVLRNDMARKYLEMEKEGAPFEELEKMTLGSLRRAVQELSLIHI